MPSSCSALTVGIPIFLGGLLAGVPVLAVAAIMGLGVGTAALARRSRFGPLAMTLSLPMVGVGLSYSDVSEAPGLAALIVLGSTVVEEVPLRRRDLDALAGTPAPLHPRAPRGPAPTLGYGFRLGAAGASAAAIGFILNLDHVGWACAAALLVMRPVAEMQRLRSVERILAVTLGALVAIALVRVGPPASVYSLVVLALLAGVAGTHGSRWYVTPAFTTLLASCSCSTPTRTTRPRGSANGCSRPCSESPSRTCSASFFLRSLRHANSATAVWTQARRLDIIDRGFARLGWREAQPLAREGGETPRR